ncbi:sensor histidine kinase [Leifsonia xyli]|uniref:sensor histidine kinase n=1 Tax=Leifsonia xyli TaxID=1575 RepID=UPI00159F03F4|nr:HAMP domain-containing sensor histidine kinase [Leifsonia xyli]
MPRYAFGTSPGVVGYNVDSGMEVQFDSLYVITDTADLLTLLLAVSLGALVVLALAGGALGWVLAGRMLRPLAAINAAASKAATGALDHRVALAGPRDEIRDLSDTFDTMLAALERSFEVHWRFAANASHELRTPLTTTQTMIDVTMADPEADAESLRALAGRVREVNSANIATVGALLDLSDIDRSRLTRTPFDVAAVVAEGAAQAAEADRNGVSLNVETPDRESGPVEVVGDPVLVRQAVGNLIQNAIRHNEPGGTAAVRVTRLADRAVVTVTNTGPPVDPGIVESLVEPFVRGSGRTTGRGYGLGLALAASIADAHDGSLRLAANPSGGLIAELTLPTSP